MHCRSLKKLSEESLTRQPEEVFDIICKLGEGSYGSVYKALHKESDQVRYYENMTHTLPHIVN
jgi:serine/threonine protein kinase